MAASDATAAPAPNKPVAVFRAKGVKVSVFENHTRNTEQDSVFYKTTVQRIYREGEQFKTTTSLGRDDLPVARHLLQKAWEFILDAEGKKPEENSD